MRCLPKLICIFCIVLPLSLVAQKPIELSSPNGKIIFSFKLQNKSARYSVRFKGNTIVDYSSLHLNFENGEFKNNLILNKPIYRDTIEEYTLITGKVKKVIAHYKEVTIPLEESIAPFRKINIVVRVFDDGLAFRYSWPRQHNWDAFLLHDEITSVRFKGDPTMHALLLPNYTTSHEGFYTSLPLSKVKNDTLIDMPALFDFHNSTYLAITEAALTDYAGMYLCKHNDVLESRLSPLPNQSIIKVKAVLPHQSPWRVFMLSDRVGALIESNILTSLNEPNKVHDVGWIKPGKTTFPWWNGNIVPDTLVNPGNNFETAKYYIDFCSRNNIEYHSVVEYGLHQWYMDDGVNFQPGPNADVTTPVPGLDMQKIVDYATAKGVGIRVWVHWAALYPKLDSAFALFKKWGIKGMMVDFMDRDDQEMVNIQTEILQKAAAHHFHIQFHGSYKPTGLNRTYPNEFTREGTLNYEGNKWNDIGLSPDHDLSIIFTRMLAGSTDYHLGGFRAVPQNLYKAQYSMPLMLGTRCHMLAMYVVLENYLQMVCDYPAAYEGQPGFEFIKNVPTTWDETKVLNSKIGEYITIARRNNNDWYIGAISNHQSRMLRIPLKFLKDGKYLAEIYSDAKDVDTM
ncbi:MAG: glycoside hydrolase family 97 protein, partial [Chitinophagaceae bacterium]